MTNLRGGTLTLCVLTISALFLLAPGGAGAENANDGCFIWPAGEGAAGGAPGAAPSALGDPRNGQLPRQATEVPNAPSRSAAATPLPPALGRGLAACNPAPTAKNPLVLAELQVWHGLDSHTPAYSGAPWVADARAYDSGERSVIERQILAAKATGIDGFVIDWYGPAVAGLTNTVDREFMDAATSLLFEVAALPAFQPFCLALLYDEGTLPQAGLAPSAYPARAAADLAYADETYLASPVYLKLAGKPALFVFPFPDIDRELNWSSLRQAITLNEVTLIDQDPNPSDPGHDSNFDGFFAWVQPDAGGWDPLGQEWGRAYLHYFYDTMRSEPYATKVAVGGAWPGFDDSLAPWGENRFMSRRGTKTYDQTWEIATENAAPIVMISTWNDYEEGTDIESGGLMHVDMEDSLTEILIRSSPFDVSWDSVTGSDEVQVYKGGNLICSSLNRSPPATLSLASDSNFAYEIKVWTGAPDPLTKTVKIRRQDPDPSLVFFDGFESGDVSLWSPQPVAGNSQSATGLRSRHRGRFSSIPPASRASPARRERCPPLRPGVPPG